MQTSTSLLTHFATAIIAAGAGVLAKGVFDWSLADQFKGIDTLIATIDKISAKGLRRLEPHAAHALNTWRAKCTPPPNGIKALLNPSGSPALCPYAYEDTETHTSCPHTVADGSQPLYLRMTAHDAVSLADELRKQFDMLASSSPNSGELLRKVPGSPNGVVVWINARALMMRSASDAARALNSVGNVVRERLFAPRVVLECAIDALSLSDFHAQQHAIVRVDVPSAVMDNPAASPALRYAPLRDQARQHLLSGMSLAEKRSGPAQFVPRDVLQERYAVAFELAGRRDWTLWRVFGPPGSCKTSLLRAVADDFVRSGMLVVHLSPAQLAKLAGARGMTIEDVVNLLTESLRESETVPSAFRVDRTARDAFDDAFRAMLLREAKAPVVLVIDDVQTGGAWQPAIAALDALLRPRGFRFVLCGRSLPPVSSESGVITLVTTLLDRRDAHQVIDAWAGANGVGAAHEMLTNGHLATVNQILDASAAPSG
jgi:hypothetical protein